MRQLMLALVFLLAIGCSKESEKFHNNEEPFQGKTAEDSGSDFTKEEAAPEKPPVVEREQTEKIKPKQKNTKKKTNKKKNNKKKQKETDEEPVEEEELDIIVDEELAVCTDFTPTFSGNTVNVFQQDFYAEATVCEKKLLHRGSAVRFRAGDRFILSAYNATPSCDPATMINKKETKYLRMDITRNTAGNRVRTAINDNLSRNLPADASDELLAQVELASDVFGNDVTSGDVIEIAFTPEVGTVFKNKTDELVLKGDDINKLMWEVFFGDNGCCQEVKTEILAYCESL